MNDMILIIGCVFGAVALIGFFIARLLMGGGEEAKLRTRLSANSGHDPHQSPQQQVTKASGVAAMAQRMGQAAAQPFLPKTREKQSSIRKSLGFAGIYSPSAIKVMTGFKVILLAGG